MNRTIAFLGCYRAAQGKTDFYSPGTPLGGFRGDLSASNGANYSSFGKDYLTPATNDVNYPGSWTATFNLYIQTNPQPINPLPPGTGALLVTLLAIPGMVPGFGSPLQSLGLDDLGFPWPMPLTNNISTVQGVRFVDQFKNPYPAFSFPNNQSYNTSGPLVYEPTQTPGYGQVNLVSTGGAITIPCSFAHFSGSLFIADASTAGNKLLCYPNFTWDSARAALVANWFLQWPCKLIYSGPTGGPLIVDGNLNINANSISYGPVHFILNRPQCKFADILSACS